MKKLAFAVAMMLGAGAINQACDSSGPPGQGGTGATTGGGSGGTTIGGGSGGTTTGGGSGGTTIGGGSGGTTIGGGTGGGRNITIGDIGNTACSDNMDNDGDGRIDLADPECVSPLDDDESSFATGISGDNMDACKQDCFFDGNSGQGDDGCLWNLKCDSSNVGATAEKRCEYDPNFNNCPTSQSQMCINICRTITPNGCDCFGCCAVTDADGVARSVRLAATCTAAKFNDPTACPPCTQTTTCVNDCKRCELCLGKTSLPEDCYTGGGGAGGAGGAGGRSGGIYCENGEYACGTDRTACPTTHICVSGCCVLFRIN